MDFDFTTPLADSDDEFSFGKSKKAKTFNILSSDDESNGSPPHSDDENSHQNHVNAAKSREISSSTVCQGDISNCIEGTTPLSIEDVNNLDSHSPDPNLQSIPRNSPIKYLDSDIFDAEESSDEEQRENRKLLAFDPSIYDIEPQSEDEHKENCETKNSLDECSTAKTKKKRVQKKKVIEEDPREVIQREAQRIVREANISLPYHIPRQRTLSDFLARRPTLLGRLKSVPVSTVWKNLEEREKEVEELYKSESSEDEGVSNKEENPPDDIAPSKIKPAENSLELTDVCIESNKIEPENLTGTAECLPEDLKDASKCSITVEETVTHSDVEGIIDPKSQDILLNVTNPSDSKFSHEEAMDSSEKSIVNTISVGTSNEEFTENGLNEGSELISFQVNTEDILDTPTAESCKLISCENETESDKASQDFLTKSLMDHLNHKKNKNTPELLTELADSPKDPIERSMITAQLSLVPKLSADKDNIVELDVDMAKKPGKVGLIQRFIKHVKLKPKETAEVKLSLVSAETGTDGEVISVTEDAVLVQTTKKEKGPNCLTALKRSLHNSVLTTRSAIINKKIEQQRFFETENIDENSVDKILDEADKEDFEDGEEMEAFEEEEEDDCDLIEDDVDITDKKMINSDYVDEEAEESEDDGVEGDDENEEDETETEEKEEGIKLPDFSQDDEAASPFPTNLESLCSGVFPSQPIDLKKFKKLDNSESEDSSQDSFPQRTEENARVIIDEDDGETMTVKKAPRRLLISDDEDDDQEEDINNENEDEESEVDPEVKGIKDGSGDEDDDELDEGDAVGSENSEISSENEEESDVTGITKPSNEKKLEYNSEEELVEATNFLDKEAELSGSEWESEDEDEKGLSDFEADEADMEKIDQHKLKSELDKIYMQDLLMDDKREVRLLQELLLDDGELHSDGPKRQRLYRWSSQGNENNLVGGGPNSDDDAVEDLEEDLSWRQARTEREQFISSHNSQSEEVCEVSVKVTREISSKKIQVQTEKPPVPEASSPDFKLKSLLSSGRRGSFLGRGAMLARMAAAANPEGEARARTGRNMVFAAVSPPKPMEISESPLQPEVKKRKAEEIKNASKKLKFNSVNSSKRPISLLDKLREF